MGLDDSNFLTFPFFQTKKCIKLLQVKLTFIQVYLKGTMKRLVKLESLRMPFENQILTPWDIYEWADENIENIKFFYASTVDIASHTSINQNKVTTAEVFDDTRSYHCFQPNGETKLELYTLSTDEICVVKNLHVSKGLFVDIDCLKVGHYVAAVYEGQWHPSLIFEIN